MIEFREEKLANGLTLVTHTDKSTPLAIVNLLYNVGSRNEQPYKTGFAHLFEHLMFGGSRNVPDYDKVLQEVGAENNAFTNTDITNYYIVLNARNIDTALWVESDRMQFLNLYQNTFDNQKRVVIEEFKQRYLNVPYGDAWLKLRPLAYKIHSYRWATIGITPSHIESATLEDASDFYSQYYSPDNAVLVICGDIEHDNARSAVERWFGDVRPSEGKPDLIPVEPVQTAARYHEVKEKVPMDAIYIAYHMPAKGTPGYVASDLLSDLLGRGKSSRLYQRLVKQREVFNSVSASITSSHDPGLLVVSGKVNPGINLEDAERYLLDEIEDLKTTLADYEVKKVINQSESSHYFAETELMNKALVLGTSAALGNTNLANEHLKEIRGITREELLNQAHKILVNSNSSTLYYRSDAVS